MVPRKSPSVYTETLNDEMCVYEWTSKEVHALNATAARVWAMCDGKTSVSEMTDRLCAEFHLPNAEAVVWLALWEFKKKHLIEGELAVPPDHRALSRRDLIVKLGLTAAALPVVTSIVAPTALQAQSGSSQTFNFTGAAQTFTVPAGVTLITVDAYGGEGGRSPYALASRGGRVQATITVTPGESLTATVGGAGGTSDFGPSAVGAGGFNGGGNGGDQQIWGGGGGGGATDVRRGSTKLVVAGGGGGGAYQPGGHGGGTTGGACVVPTDCTGCGVSGGCGGGGTQTAGGSGGTAGDGGAAGTSGSAGIGGAGAPGQESGGGGGGGYYGGGGGGSMSGGNWGGGGGGSSYTEPGATNITHWQGVRSGNGLVIISW